MREVPYLPMSSRLRNIGLWFVFGSLFFALHPLSAFAIDIGDCTALQDMNNDLTGSYELTGDIDCTGVDFEPIGNFDDGTFEGTFDGNGYVISNLTIDNSLNPGEITGLFGIVSEAEIHDFRIEDATVTGSDDSAGVAIGYASNSTIARIGVEHFTLTTDSNNVGGFIGYSSNNAFSRIYASGGTVTALASVGGLIGQFDVGTAEDVFVTSVTVEGDNFDVGGLIGQFASVNGDVTLTNAYADAIVSAASTAGGAIGGMFQGNTCAVSNVFSVSDVTSSSNPGGLVGRKQSGCTITNGAFNDTADTPSACVGSDSNSSTTDCTVKTDNASFFYDKDNEPLASWDFTINWFERLLGLPYLDMSLRNPPTNLVAEADGATVNLSWTNPGDIDFSSITIRRSTSAYPERVADGSAVASGITGTSYSNTAVADGMYFYSVFARNSEGRYSEPATARAVVDTTAASANVCSLRTHWALNSFTASTAPDSSGNGFDAVDLAGGGEPELSTDVPANGPATNPYSYLFTANTSDYLRASRPVTDDFTICAWVKTTTAGSGDDHWESRAILHAEASGVGNDFGFGMNQDEYLIFGNGDGSSDYSIAGSTVINTGEWVHACVTRQKSSGQIRLYVDGELDGFGIGSTTSLSDSTYAYIAGANDGGQHWDGNIDDIRIYDSVLNAAEIRSIAGRTASCLMPVSSASSMSSPVATPGGSGGGRRGGPGRGGVANPLNSLRPAASVAVSSFELRTCERVMKWFKDDTKMLDRVNTRLEKRFGFTCGA